MPRCPKCNVPLCRIEMGGIPVHSCPDCGGELIEEMRLKGLERRPDPTWTDERRDELCRLADQSNDPLRTVLCPECGRIMRKRLFRGYAHLQVDQCPQCRAYWLDRGEREKMQILFEESRAWYSEKDREEG